MFVSDDMGVSAMKWARPKPQAVPVYPLAEADRLFLANVQRWIYSDENDLSPNVVSLGNVEAKRLLALCDKLLAQLQKRS